ncbi:MAG: hypothetical protein ACP5H5_01155 [Pyrobaculum sp.]
MNRTPWRRPTARADTLRSVKNTTATTQHPLPKSSDELPHQHWSLNDLQRSLYSTAHYGHVRVAVGDK